MARIAGVEIPDNKHIGIALTYIYGIGRSLSENILKELGIDKNTRTKDLKSEELNKLRNTVSKYIVEGDLRRQHRENVKRLRDIGSYRGQRHARNLPARGQTTRVNSRTVRGNKRVTVGSGKKPPAAPK